MSAQPPVTGVTPEMLAKWRSHQGQGMTSAVGEYTPDEFWLALDEIESLQKRLSEAHAWIPVSERPLPGRNPDERGGREGSYLVANAKGQVAPHIRGVIHNNVGSPWDWEYGEAITHWMPLPEAP